MKFRTTDIGGSASAPEIIHAALHKAIVSGELEVGAPLRQDEIARMFNTSRIPVREALKMLEQQGLIVMRRYRGAVVAGISPREASEMFQFRSLMEAELIRQAVPHLDSTTLEHARELNARLASETDPSELGPLNRSFHFALYDPSGLGYQLELVRRTMDRVSLYLRAELTAASDMQKAAREHDEILAACAARDAEAAAMLVARHVDDARVGLLEVLA